MEEDNSSDNSSEEPLPTPEEFKQDVNIHTIARIVRGYINRGIRSLSGILQRLDTTTILHVISYTSLVVIILQQLFEDKKNREEIKRLQDISKV